MDYPEGIRVESIRMIASMIDLLDDRFLVHNAVHKPTIKLLRFCVLDERQSELYHEDLVDLMYIICSKIHRFPALLNIFFHDKQWLTTPQKAIPASANHIREPSSKESSDTTPHSSSLFIIEKYHHPEYEFLLFTYLLRFVHREGRTGDFARTGLLFLIEMATDQLGDFILESDFASIMSAGLGALYSQLPRKLIIRDENEINSTPAAYLLVGHDDLDPSADYLSKDPGVKQSNSEQFKYQLDSFLKLLEFCQDVLIRCPNNAISKSLLQYIRNIFLENILYPSILECSDTDGSSVAVVSYIDLILQTIQQQDLSTIVVGFLMDTSDDKSDQFKVTNIKSTTSSSISQYNQYSNLFHGVELDKLKSSPYFTATAERFTLKDLIFSRLKSSSQTTVIATLKLLKTLIVKHCRFADRLLTFYPDATKIENNQDGQEYSSSSSTIISHHIREIELYFALISSIDHAHADDILTIGYEDYLKDIENMMESDSCFHDLIDLPHESKHSSSIGEIDENPLIQILLGLLSHFFAQSSELNLALSGAISALALCPYRSLEGWISFTTLKDDPIHGNDLFGLSTFQEQEKVPDADDDESIDFGVDRNSIYMTTPTQFKCFPPFYTLLQTLTQQVDYYRSEIDEFDDLLKERWNSLLFGEPRISTNVTSSSIIPIMPSSSIRRRSFLFDNPSMKPSTSSSTITSTNQIGASSQTNNNAYTTLLHTGYLKKSSLSLTPVINPLSPFALHAKRTREIRIQPLFPSNFETERDEQILNMDEDNEDVFAPPINPSERRRINKSKEIPLSMLLNNVVILEEMIKELVAIMQVRRSLGIDKIRY
ncbi:Retinoic acid induced 16-like protein-domain-containing protein, partial [Cokeromyces recurvatus]|uniref:Retinoic acid induced 16-like protein-domain-containing protein n=1 Tax=Cokeromyces recurvatus TaxID=90255 RepID=UPI00221FBE1A